MEKQPAYVTSGVDKIRQKGEQARRLWESCVLCPCNCRVDRPAGEKGKCGGTGRTVISGYGPHFGEESVLVGRNGSGTIFFVYCNLECIFCQNWTISRGTERGSAVTPRELAAIMMELQDRGCHNINLVTPTPYIPLIISSIAEAAGEGLSIPIVYNCGGYESAAALKLLDGIIDIYMPDCKYADPETGKRLSGVSLYPEKMKTALKEMQRQVGDLKTDERGIAYRGLLVRHLVLPGGLAGTGQIVKFLAAEISANCAINIMEQYYPAYRAGEAPPLDRRVTRQEFKEALALAEAAGLRIIR